MSAPQKPPPRKRPGDDKETVKRAFIALLKVRTIITLAIMGVTSYLAVTGAIGAETFMTIASAVITYYFTRRDDKER